MGCKFCATGLGGFDRNLTAGEIVGQYLLLQRLTEKRISHVVFMGMGEPLLNLPNVVKALKLLHEEVGLSYRNLTVSTVGLVPQIRELSREKFPIHLALSLHSPVDQVMVEERAASFAKRSIKSSAKLTGLKMVTSMMDLTTLEGQDTPGKVAYLCGRGFLYCRLPSGRLVAYW